MKKVFEYSHLGGLEILKVRYPYIEQEIDKIYCYVIWHPRDFVLN